MSAKLSKAVTSALVQGCKDFTKAQASVESAVDRRDTMTGKILEPAATVGSLEVWDAYRAELDRTARAAFKTTGVAMGYVQEEREDKGGNKTLHTIPSQQLANVFSGIRQTYAKGLKFNDAKGNPLSFDRLKKNLKLERDKDNKKAKGRKADILRLNDVLKTIRTKAKNYGDEDLHNFVNRMAAEAKAMPTSKAKAS